MLFKWAFGYLSNGRRESVKQSHCHQAFEKQHLESLNRCLVALFFSTLLLGTFYAVIKLNFKISMSQKNHSNTLGLLLKIDVFG